MIPEVWFLLFFAFFKTQGCQRVETQFGRGKEFCFFFFFLNTRETTWVCRAISQILARTPLGNTAGGTEQRTPRFPSTNAQRTLSVESQGHMIYRPRRLPRVSLASCSRQNQVPHLRKKKNNNPQSKTKGKQEAANRRVTSRGYGTTTAWTESARTLNEGRSDEASALLSCCSHCGCLRHTAG